MKKKFLVFDTETNGLPNEDNFSNVRLVEIGCILVEFCDGKFQILEKYNALSKYILDETELENTYIIHKIDNNMTSKYGIDIENILMKFKYLYSQTDFVVCHNKLFDLSVMINEYKLIKDEFWKILMYNNNSLCTQKNDYKYIDGAIYEYDKDRIKLRELFNVFFPNDSYNEHSAICDAEATYEIFKKMILNK